MKPVAIGRGIIAGLVASAVLSAVMLMKKSLGLMPELDPIAMITAMAGARSPAVGWIGHFVIGTSHFVIGTIFLGCRLCDRQSLLAWLVLVARDNVRRGRVVDDDDRGDADGGGRHVRAWPRHDGASGDSCFACSVRPGAWQGLRLAWRQTNIDRKLFALNGIKSQRKGTEHGEKILRSRIGQQI